MDSEKKNLITPLLLIFIVSSAVYLNILPNGFVHDDNDQIVENVWLRDLRNIPAVLFSSVWAFLEEKGASNYYRPVMHLVYMADYAVFGLKAWGWHLTSLLINSLNSVMVFVVIMRLLRERAAKTARPHDLVVPAAAGALLFAAHPVHTEAVAWAAGIPELAFAFFYLASFHLYMRYRDAQRGVFLAASAGSFFLSAMSKEPALTLPMALAAYDVLLRGDRPLPITPWMKRYAPFVAMGLLYMGLRISALSGFAPRGAAHELTAFENILNVFPLLMDYFRYLVLPLDLNFFHTFIPVRSMLDARAIGSLVFLAVMAAALLSLKKERLVLFSVLLVIIPLLPAFYIPGLGRNTFAERYLYLPSIGLSLLVSTGLLAASARKNMKTACVVLVMAAMALFSVLTIKRNFDYRDEYSIWSDTVRKSPDNGFVLLNMGVALARSGDDDGAIASYKKSLTSLYLAVDITLTHYNLANAYARKGLFDDAIRHYERTLEIDPSYYKAMNNLGGVYARTGDLDSAIFHFKKTLDIKPGFKEAEANLERARRLRDERNDDRRW